MDKHEVTELSMILRAYYGPIRFPGLEPGMVDYWHESLERFATDVVRRAVRQWARHHNNKPPSLDEVEEAAERVVDDDRRARLPATPKGPVEVLQDAAELVAERSPDDGLYARLMCRLVERLPRGQWPEQCRLWSTHYAPKRPTLALWLEQAAQQYETLLPTTDPTTPASASRIIPLMGTTTSVQPRQEPCPHAHLHENGACNDCGEVLAGVA